jgi:hypothetical protein
VVFGAGAAFGAGSFFAAGVASFFAAGAAFFAGGGALFFCAGGGDGGGFGREAGGDVPAVMTELAHNKPNANLESGLFPGHRRRAHCT